MVSIRLAQAEDLPSLPAIERAAGEVFRSLGMDAIAEDEPPSMDELGGHHEAGRLWVAEDDGRIVAYLSVDVVAGAAHIEQVSVHPDVAGRRIGSQLIDIAEQWAHGQGLTQLTLTTYRDVPWNAPYYGRLGFHIVAETEQPSELQAVRSAEFARGLDAWPRVAMRRPVDSPR